MGARVIDGRGPDAELKEGLAAEVPGLVTVLVGSPAEAEVYERRVRSLETATTDGIVGNDTIFARSVRRERIIR
jgi:hypothetical protein